MINKTSSVIFHKYGEVYSTLAAKADLPQDYYIHHFDVSCRSIHSFYKTSEDIYCRAIKGLILLVITDDIRKDHYDEFIMHRTVKINKGTFFNFIAVSDDCQLEVCYSPNTTTTSHMLEHSYHYHKIIHSFQVEEILSFFYTVRSSNYLFPGETTDYWELTFVDNGTMNTKVDDTTYTLNNYDLILYAPHQFHDQSTQDNTCSYLTIIFKMNIAEPDLLINRVFHADRDLAKVVNLFVQATTNASQYSSGLMVCYLQELLIRLLQTYEKEEKGLDNASPIQQHFENELMNEIVNYIHDNICSPLTIEELCYHFSISRSSLQSLFRNNMGIAPKKYISNLKLKKAKVLIKENKYTISEISSILGYASIHYFSRKFRAHYGITPTDYAKTIY